MTFCSNQEATGYSKLSKRDLNLLLHFCPAHTLAPLGLTCHLVQSIPGLCVVAEHVPTLHTGLGLGFVSVGTESKLRLSIRVAEPSGNLVGFYRMWL